MFLLFQILFLILVFLLSLFLHSLFTCSAFFSIVRTSQMTTFHFGETLHIDNALIGRTSKNWSMGFLCFYHSTSSRLEYQSVTRVPVCLEFPTSFLPKNCSRPRPDVLSGNSLRMRFTRGKRIPVLRKGSPLIMLILEHRVGQNPAMICSLILVYKGIRH